ncbi:SGNH/GDSL hydrolase family protein [Candidatus Pelagibacter ubique]|uniref:SGNH/GDSL hydrolase family protein n=1 Tax=Pelagibacter ubique TaxID=198252 RepID=UPI0003C7FA25
MKKIILNSVLVLTSILITIILAEVFLILKNRSIINYDIEMWKYSKLLKEKVENPKISHIHKKNTTAELQKTKIRINNLGMRGDDVNLENLDIYNDKIMILGSSIALGWGVKQDQIFTEILKKKIYKEKNQKVIFFNTGTGNYNTQRYINNYFEYYSEIPLDKILILFFVNDTEILSNNDGNFFTRNFHLGVLIWKYFQTFNDNLVKKTLKKYYEEKYNKNYLGLKIALKNLQKLSNNCRDKKLECIIVMVPDIHNLENYELKFIHVKMKKISEDLGFKYLDLLDEFIGIESKSIWNKYNDPHPNARGHEIIANGIFKIF